MTSVTPILARARTDARDWLVEAEEPLAGLQLRSGGELPGVVATPALLELVRRARSYGLRLAGSIRAFDEGERISAWVEVEPDEEGCEIAVLDWQAAPEPVEPPEEAAAREQAVIRQAAELGARLTAEQAIVSAEALAPDLLELGQRMTAGAGRPWTDFVDLGEGSARARHWRLLDGAKVAVEGSAREWTAHLIPLGIPEPGSDGFELYLVATTPLPQQPPAAEAPDKPTFSSAIGREIAPVLRQPIARIIANAETIRTQLAGPLAEEYSNYAADIATAGEHLLALIDDLVALEVVEDEQFSPAPDRIDLADLARRAAGILGVRAQERGIAVEAPEAGESVPAIGEFRRVLQVLLNLLGNAIRYSPEGSRVRLTVEHDQDRARVTVADEGEGIAAEMQERLFDKFERLGRSGDGGSGLGLYISRRLARAMDGDLTVDSAPGQGARFTLELPSFAERRARPRS